MITVSISINGNPILTRSATRGEVLGNGEYEYNLDDGSVVEHEHDKGAVELAKKMLDKIDKDFVTKDVNEQQNVGDQNGRV